MNPKVHEEALEEVRKGLSRSDSVRSAILFGSTARGTATGESDIDLLIECDETAEGEVDRFLFDLQRRFHVPIVPLFYRGDDWRRFDLQLLESIFRHGRVLLGKMPSLTPIELDLQPLRLVSYQTRDLSPRRKARFLRAIDGYRTVKRVNGKRYVVDKQGFLAEVGGWRVGRGAVLVPEEALEPFDALLKRHGVKRHIIPIWSQRP